MNRFARLFAVSSLAVLSFVVGVAGVSCTAKTRLEPANAVHLLTPFRLKGLDPAMADDPYAAEEVGRVYEGLLSYHYLRRPYTLVPNLAESLPDPARPVAFSAWTVVPSWTSA